MRYDEFTKTTAWTRAEETDVVSDLDEGDR